jgi:hypothetical protein
LWRVTPVGELRGGEDGAVALLRLLLPWRGKNGEVSEWKGAEGGGELLLHFDEPAELRGPPRGAWRAAPHAGDHAASAP